MEKDEIEKISHDCGIAYIDDGKGNYKYVVYVRDIYQKELLGEIWGAGDSKEEALKQAFKNLASAAFKSIPVGKESIKGMDFYEILECFKTGKGFLPSPPEKIMPSFDLEGEKREILGIAMRKGKPFGVTY